MKKLIYVNLIILMILAPNFLLAINASQSQIELGLITGLVEPTEEQKQWIEKNFPIIKKIRLNDIALERINSERRQKGLEPIQVDGLATLGSEAVFSSDIIPETQPEIIGALPLTVDNSLSPAFPDIRSQGSLGSCASWATTYYQFTYENNLVLGRSAKGTAYSAIFSPKWTYNMINGGANAGSYFSDNYNILLKHGAVSWAEFPYDSNYLQWYLNPVGWRNALNYRPSSQGRIYNSNIETVITDIKAQLTNGHVLVIGTYVTSWNQTIIKNDISILEDDNFINQKIASYVKNTNQGAHGMTVVGYNDYIWCDINGNNIIESSEKGAFKVANSWGTSDWNAGYRWVAYDALKGTSLVPSTSSWPASNRSISGIFWTGDIYTVTASSGYKPKIIAEFTLNQLKRVQIYINLGLSEVTSTTPSQRWYPEALTYSGGNYAFDGTTTACDATFVFDFTDLATATGINKRWYLEIQDSALGSVTTLKSYKLYEVTETGDKLVGTYSNISSTCDGSKINPYIEYAFGTINQAPIAKATASPTSGNIPLVVDFNASTSYDPDGTIMQHDWNFGDGVTGVGSTIQHTYTSAGIFTVILTVTDNLGAKSSSTLTITVIDSNTINAPSNLVAKGSRGLVTLTWSDNSNNEDGFIIERATKTKTGYTAFSITKTTGPNTTSLIFSENAGQYKYRIKAFKGTNNSIYSNEVIVKVR